MHIKKIILLIFVGLLLPIRAWAGCTETSPGVWEPDNLTVSDVQKCVDDATGAADYRDGDTILLPEDDVTWYGYVTVDKGVSIIGKGTSDPLTSITRTGNSHVFYINTTQGPRISNIRMKYTLKASEGLVKIASVAGSASGSSGFRIDNNLFTVDGGGGDDFSKAVYYAAGTAGGTPIGLIDNNTFKRCRILIGTTNQEYNNWHWSRDYWFGTGNTIIIEDNYFDNTPGSLSGSAKTCVDGDFGGPGYVFRYNTAVNGYILIHHSQAMAGDNVRRGSRAWEIYGNEVSQSADYTQYARPIYLRSGTGFCFDNTLDNTNSFGAFEINVRVDGGDEPRVLNTTTQSGPGECDGTNDADMNLAGYMASSPGYLCIDQVGAGKQEFHWSTWGTKPDQERKPAYFWGNNVSVTAGGQSAYIAQNRDYYDDDDSHMQSGTYTEMQAVSSPTEGDGFWVTNRGGDWCDDSSPNCPNGDSQDGALYVYTSGAWAEYYVPHDYPHPLIGGDSTAPTVTETIIGTDESTVAVYFSESIVSTGYDNGDFDLDCSISGNNIALNGVSGSGTSRTFESAIPLDASDVCNLDYTGGSNDIEDTSGNDLAAFSDNTDVTNTIGADSTPPTVESVVVESDGLTVTFTFSELVDTTDLDNGDFELDCTSHLGNPMLYVSGSGDTRTFTAGYVILPTDSCVANSVPALYSEGEVHDLSENPLAQFSDQEVTNNTGSEVVAGQISGMSAYGGTIQ